MDLCLGSTVLVGSFDRVNCQGLKRSMGITVEPFCVFKTGDPS